MSVPIAYGECDECGREAALYFLSDFSGGNFCEACMELLVEWEHNGQMPARAEPETKTK